MCCDGGILIRHVIDMLWTNVVAPMVLEMLKMSESVINPMVREKCAFHPSVMLPSLMFVCFLSCIYLWYIYIYT